MRWADVLVESYTPGVMEAWGLGYDDLRAVNPQLVMVSTSLMGQTGPLSEFAGFGNLAGAITGFYELTGWPDRPPAGPFLAYTDYVAPRYSVAALLAALDWRRRTGRGQHLDLSQAEASIHFLAPAILDHTINGVHPTRAGNADAVFEPHGVFPCTGDDEWVAIACEDDAHRTALAGVVGATTDAAIEAWTSARSISEVEDAAAGGRRARPRRAELGGVLERPQLVHRGHYLTVEHPVHGQCIVEGARVVLSRTPAVVRRANPKMGEHNHHVLHDLLGYDEDHVTELVIAGALG